MFIFCDFIVRLVPESFKVHKFEGKRISFLLLLYTLKSTTLLLSLSLIFFYLFVVFEL